MDNALQFTAGSALLTSEDSNKLVQRKHKYSRKVNGGLSTQITPTHPERHGRGLSTLVEMHFVSRYHGWGCSTHVEMNFVCSHAWDGMLLLFSLARVGFSEHKLTFRFCACRHMLRCNL